MQLLSSFVPTCFEFWLFLHDVFEWGDGITILTHLDKHCANVLQNLESEGQEVGVEGHGHGYIWRSQVKVHGWEESEYGSRNVWGFICISYCTLSMLYTVLGALHNHWGRRPRWLCNIGKVSKHMEFGDRYLIMTYMRVIVHDFRYICYSQSIKGCYTCHNLNILCMLTSLLHALAGPPHCLVCILYLVESHAVHLDSLRVLLLLHIDIPHVDT